MLTNIIKVFDQNKGPVVLLTVAFFISRFFLYLLHVTFYPVFINRLWQVVDFTLLQNNLMESLLYLHAQPPIFNLILGVLVKCFPEKYPQVFHLLNMAFSLVSCLLLYLSLIHIGINRKIATITSLIFILTPALMLYEKMFSYTILTIFMVTLLMFCTINALRTRSPFWFHALCWTASILALTRSSFHLFFIVIFVGVVFWIINAGLPRTRFMILAAVPLMIVTGWYVKNLYFFKSFSATTWLGMNMARVQPPDTPLGKVRPFRPLQEYKGYYASTTPVKDIPLLTTPVKSSGFNNYHHQDYITISTLFRKDVFHSIAEDPGAYLSEVVKASTIYFTPATHAPFIDRNLMRIQPFASWFNFDFSNYEKYHLQNDDRRQFMLGNGFTTTGALPAFSVSLISLVALGLLWRRALLGPLEKNVIIALLMLLSYGMLVGVSLEFGENNRFRFELSAPAMLLCALTVSRLLLLFQKIKH